MRVDLLTKEYPPEVYGGAGVHAGELARELLARVDLRVRCFGGPRPGAEATAYPEPEPAVQANPALRALAVNVEMAAACAGADVVHSHTWYANAAGRLAKVLYGTPHVVTLHSLEPLRPWKAEQLGGGYALSSLLERTAVESADAVIAVSAGMRRDILAVYPEVVADGETGILVPVKQEQDGSGTPLDPERFAADLAAAVNGLLRDPGLARAMGAAGRVRATEQFSWRRCAERTHGIYRSVLGRD